MLMDYVKSLSDVCGVADFRKDSQQLIETYGQDICKYPYAIVIGHRLNEEIVSKIPLSYNDDDIAEEYQNEYFNSFKRISGISHKVEDYIHDLGYNCVILNELEKYEDIHLKTRFSNKASAKLAGIGWIGKNNLLTTREYGPRLTWSTIITDAPLSKYTGNVMESLCGDCNICVKACPGGAIVNLDNPRKSYSPIKCGDYIKSRKKEGHPTVCGMCLYICPYGNKI
ncbi:MULTISPECIES: 4Fe-4S double cluster binding domain-containing protein [Methanosphaera]|uniref:Predicted Fe-S protein n=2 Tax=Methanosphaera stadtmanae TaxID=2317 RepID=Q2NGT3_METST|nr:MULTISPECIES: 4Fe-4S double cluster binding domain-containing protein [Methanosphaera]ABC56970.1 predicted Fe-S protein [Methanosphaera stadtmanae DSM 3091]MEE0489209.1 4Fe-4S binding protein [Methanosphaera stadtmanae]OEC92095.1 hypothetical protein A9758_01390 [Methanosphaera sp. A6]RAP03349.1 hypothetical protein CA615_02745 [Methanosphaera stadtmanae]RAP47983.1 MAG: hypothetical protein BZ132_02780 [Methanosphaera sp. DEW79]